MKKVLFTSVILSVAFICHAQQAKKGAAPVKFTLPVIVKDAAPAKSEKKDMVRFTPPVIKKNEQVRKPKKVEIVKFTPPVIVKDSD